MRKARKLSETPVFEPPLERWPVAGVYQLWLEVSVDIRVTVGRLGRFAFPSGLYVYTGRASRGLPARVARYVRGAAKKHWHIDYLLARREVRVRCVVLVSDDPERECAVNQALVGAMDQDLAGTVSCPAPGFGASDCRAGCLAHLWRREYTDEQCSVGPLRPT